MTAEMGAFALVLALTLSLAQVALSAVGRARRDATLRGAGEGAALAAFGAMAIAFAALMTAFVTSDFSVANVQANSNIDQPLFYRITATWGSHEGSMLLWNLALTGMGERHRPVRQEPARGAEGQRAGQPGRARRAVHRLHRLRLQPLPAHPLRAGGTDGR